MTAKELYLEAMRRSDAGEHDAFLDLQADDATWSVPNGEFVGKDAVREWLTVFWRGFSSYRHDISFVEELGGTVVAEGIWAGTHDGPLVTPEGELPPTGRTVSFRWAMLATIDVEAQIIRSARIYFDQMGFLGQLGLLPAAAAT
jgi:predicted ester cyclase